MQVQEGKGGKGKKKEECTLAGLNRIVIDTWREASFHLNQAEHKDVPFWTPTHSKIAALAVYDGKKNLFTPQFLDLPKEGYQFTISVIEDSTAGFLKVMQLIG